MDTFVKERFTYSQTGDRWTQQLKRESFKSKAKQIFSHLTADATPQSTQRAKRKRKHDVQWELDRQFCTTGNIRRNIRINIKISFLHLKSDPWDCGVFMSVCLDCYCAIYRFILLFFSPSLSHCVVTMFISATEIL